MDVTPVLCSRITHTLNPSKSRFRVFVGIFDFPIYWYGELINAKLKIFFSVKYSLFQTTIISNFISKTEKNVKDKNTLT